MLDQVYTAADSSQPTILVSLDLSAAFDTIDHHILLTRLQTGFGISGSVINWIRSYLTDRVQRVVVGQSKSTDTSLSTGVPEGSVLGPILFSVFTSPVGHIISSSGIHHQQYADNTQLFISLTPSSQYDSISRLEQCLLTLHEWFCVNGLALNPDKSEAIWLSTHQRSRTLPPHTSVNVAGTTVQITDKIKTLGVTLDNQLTFDQHVSGFQPLANPAFTTSGLSAIFELPLHRKWRTRSPFLLVTSRLDYANSLLFGTAQANLNKLQRIQNTFAKLFDPNHTRSADALRYLALAPCEAAHQL